MSPPPVDTPLQPSPLSHPSEATSGDGETASSSHWKRWLKLGISLTLLAVVGTQIGWQQTFARLSQAEPWALPLGVGLYLLSQYISAWRWRALAEGLDFTGIGIVTYYRWYLTGMFFSLFLPGAIGGDVARVWYLAKATGKQKRHASLSILAERGFGFWSITALSAAAVWLATPRLPESLGWLMAGVAALVGLGVAFPALLRLWLAPMHALSSRFPKLTPFSEWLADGADLLSQHRRVIATTLLSLGVHGCMLAVHLAIAAALGVTLDPWYLLATYGLVSLASILPIAFNGIGIREGGYVLLLGRAGLSNDTALAFALYWFAVSSLTSLIGGGWWLLNKGENKA